MSITGAIDNIVSYSTSEKVVGKWIDGKLIYQKTVSGKLTTTVTNQRYTANAELVSNVDTLVEAIGTFRHTSAGTAARQYVPCVQYNSDLSFGFCAKFSKIQTGEVYLTYDGTSIYQLNNNEFTATILYTKT